MEHRERGQPLSWRLSTLNASESKLELAVLNPHLFIREEIADAFKSEEPYTHRRTLLKCPTLECNNTVTIYAGRGGKNLEDYKCRSCAYLALRKRPYGRTFNKTARNTRHRTKKIDWLISYEDFVSLCHIPNCHYCNKPLGRAAYAGDEGSDALLLDRKDSNKDYTLDNCVPCCPKCNFTKNDRVSYAEMVLVMKHRGCWVEKE
jgi:5-methylcytosine-specific restriction endonuclease McrA